MDLLRIASRVASVRTAGIDVPSDDELREAVQIALKACQESPGAFHGVWGDDQYGHSIIMSADEEDPGVVIVYYVPDIDKQGMEEIYSSFGEWDESAEWDENAAVEAVRGAIEKAAERATGVDSREQG